MMDGSGELGGVISRSIYGPLEIKLQELSDKVGWSLDEVASYMYEDETRYVNGKFNGDWKLYYEEIEEIMKNF